MIDHEPLWTALAVSFRLAFSTVLVLFCFGVPVAYWLAFTKSRLKPFLESIVSVPIALPPTVIGFYVLLCFGRESLIGTWFSETLGVELVFSFWGILLGSVLYCLPFMVQPVKTGLESVPKECVESARLDGASVLQVLWRVLLPLSRRSIVVGAALTFVHALGEFGIVMMIGGSIEGETRTASIALYDAVQALKIAEAHRIALVILAVALFVSLVIFWHQRSMEAEK